MTSVHQPPDQATRLTRSRRLAVFELASPSLQQVSFFPFSQFTPISEIDHDTFFCTLASTKIERQINFNKHDLLLF